MNTFNPGLRVGGGKTSLSRPENQNSFKKKKSDIFEQLKTNTV